MRAVESYNARDFDACINAAEQVLTALPGNVHATELIEKSRKRKDAAAALRGRARPRAGSRSKRGDTTRRARELEQHARARPGASGGLAARAPDLRGRAAPPPQPRSRRLGGMMDLGEPGGSGFGAARTSRTSPSTRRRSSGAGSRRPRLAVSRLLSARRADRGGSPPPRPPARRGRGPLDRPAGSPGSPERSLERSLREPAPAAAPLRAAPPHAVAAPAERRRTLRARGRESPAPGRRSRGARGSRRRHRDLVAHLPDRHQQRRSGHAHREDAPGHGRGRSAPRTTSSRKARRRSTRATSRARGRRFSRRSRSTVETRRRASPSTASRRSSPQVPAEPPAEGRAAGRRGHGPARRGTPRKPRRPRRSAVASRSGSRRGWR